MAKTLLDITQEILTVMTSDEVNSIYDTAEAEAVARIVCSTFEAMVSNKNWESHKELIQLESFSDNARPTHCRLPENVKELIFVKYNKMKEGDARLRYEDVKWKDPEDFLIYVNHRDSTSSTVQTVTDPTGIKLLILNDRHPSYYTSFDDSTMVFDSFFSTVDDTIQPSNTQAYGYVMPEPTLADSWEPDLPKEAIKALVEEAKSIARFQIDSTSDVKAEQESARQKRWLSRKSWSVNGGLKYPNYGRRTNKVMYDPTFKRNN